jgi:hypothetical protein
VNYRYRRAYRRSAARITSVSDSPRFSAAAFAARHSSSGTRTARSGVSGTARHHCPHVSHMAVGAVAQIRQNERVNRPVAFGTLCGLMLPLDAQRLKKGVGGIDAAGVGHGSTVYTGVDTCQA